VVLHFATLKSDALGREGDLESQCLLQVDWNQKRNTEFGLILQDRQPKETVQASQANWSFNGADDFCATADTGARIRCDRIIQPANLQSALGKRLGIFSK
jgi:hypothetical protein